MEEESRSTWKERAMLNHLMTLIGIFLTGLLESTDLETTTNDVGGGMDPSG
jgi:hypothetical protein